MNEINVKVRDFRGLERADIVVDGITLVAGVNGAGKSSICQAVAAAVSGYSIPFIKPGASAGEFKAILLKKDVARLIRSGTKKAYVEVKGYDGEASVAWPKCNVETGGTPPVSSVFSAGIASVVGMTAPVRGEFLSTVLGAIATKDHLLAKLDDEGVGEDAIKAAMVKLEDSGWDDTHSHYKTAATSLKGKWEGITDERWGGKKAAGWVHPGLVEGVALADLERDLADAQSVSEGLAGKGAVSAERVSNLKRQLELAQDDANDLANVKVEYDAAMQAEAEAEALEGPGKILVANASCPHCDDLIFVGKSPDGSIYTKPGVDAASDEATSASDFLAEKRKTINAASGVRLDVRMKLDRCKVAATRSENLTDEIKKAEKAEKAPLPEVIGAAREAVMVAAAAIVRFEAAAKAEAINKSIVEAISISAMTAPDGVRRERLIRALREFNEGILEGLCATAKYRRVRIDEDMNLTYDGRPYPLLSESEKFRVRSVMQFAIANERDDIDDNLIIIDGADILDKPGLNGLIKLSAELIKADGRDCGVLIGMTISERSDVPDLKKAGMGRSYWVEEGVAEEIGV